MQVNKIIKEISEVYSTHHFITSKSLTGLLAETMVITGIGTTIISYAKSMSPQFEISFSEALVQTIIIYTIISLSVLFVALFDRSGFIVDKASNENRMRLQDQLPIMELWPRLAKLLFVSLLFALLLYIIIESTGKFATGAYTSTLAYSFFNNAPFAEIFTEFLIIVFSSLVVILGFGQHAKMQFQDDWHSFPRKKSWVAIYLAILVISIYLILNWT